MSISFISTSQTIEYIANTLQTSIDYDIDACLSVINEKDESLSRNVSVETNSHIVSKGINNEAILSYTIRIKGKLVKGSDHKSYEYLQLQVKDKKSIKHFDGKMFIVEGFDALRYIHLSNLECTSEHELDRSNEALFDVYSQMPGPLIGYVQHGMGVVHAATLKELGEK